MYQLLLRNGLVIDPSQGLHERLDVGIADGRIAALASKLEPAQAREVIDVSGKIVAPGLVDFHCHVAGSVVDGAVSPDECGVLAGVTTVCDGGSAGYANLADFLRHVVAPARTRVYCFLNVAPKGLAEGSDAAARHDPRVDSELLAAAIEEHRDLVKGIKIMAKGALVENLGVDAIRVAKSVAQQTGVPLMVHIGIEPSDGVTPETAGAFTREMLRILDKGDIITHVYTWKAGGVFEAYGAPFPELLEAIERGVILDVARAGTHWSFDVARRALDRAIMPTIVSTDMARRGIDGPVFSLPATMSAFLALGLSLDQLIAMATINPARALGEEARLGSLRVGFPADVSVFELVEGEFIFEDGVPGRTFRGERLLAPKIVLKDGTPIQCQARFRNAAPDRIGGNR